MRIKKILIAILAACILICASGCSEAERVRRLSFSFVYVPTPVLVQRKTK